MVKRHGWLEAATRDGLDVTAVFNARSEDHESKGDEFN